MADQDIDKPQNHTVKAKAKSVAEVGDTFFENWGKNISLRHKAVDRGFGKGLLGAAQFNMYTIQASIILGIATALVLDVDPAKDTDIDTGTAISHAFNEEGGAYSFVRQGGQDYALIRDGDSYQLYHVDDEKLSLYADADDAAARTADIAAALRSAGVDAYGTSTRALPVTIDGGISDTYKFAIDGGGYDIVRFGDIDDLQIPVNLQTTFANNSQEFWQNAALDMNDGDYDIANITDNIGTMHEYTDAEFSAWERYSQSYSNYLALGWAGMILAAGGLAGYQTATGTGGAARRKKFEKLKKEHDALEEKALTAEGLSEKEIAKRTELSLSMLKMTRSKKL